MIFCLVWDWVDPAFAVRRWYGLRWPHGGIHVFITKQKNRLYCKYGSVIKLVQLIHFSAVEMKCDLFAPFDLN